MWFESRLYTPDKNQQLLNALLTLQQMAVNDIKANIINQLSENTSCPQSFVGSLHLDPVERPSVFRPFYDIPQKLSNINSTIGNLAETASLYYGPVYPQTLPSRHVDSLPFPNRPSECLSTASGMKRRLIPPSPFCRDYVVSTPHTSNEATYQESYAAFSTYAKQAAGLSTPRRGPRNNRVGFS